MTEDNQVSGTPRSPLPNHLAVIMDGNGRWALERNLSRFEGHKAGVNSVRMVTEQCRKAGIRYLTLFAFSTENWMRPRDEVSLLMSLFSQFLRSELKSLLKNNIRLRALGDLGRLPGSVRKELERACENTADLNGMDLVLAVSYGGREEIVQAARNIASEVLAGRIERQAVNEDLFRKNLYLPDVPDPDLLIRTSGETRVSNFLLWQLAYSEIVVSNLLWPDFDAAELKRCLDEFGRRRRRFGMTEEQIANGASCALALSK
jgi:undecaprenyl diphosphate synthase